MKNKNILAATISLIMVISFVGCSVNEKEQSHNESFPSGSSITSSSVTSSLTTIVDSSTNNEPEFISQIPEEIEQKYKSVVEKLRQELDNAYAATGDSYESYVKNKQSIKNWYELVASESGELFDYTLRTAVKYYKEIAASKYRENSEAVDKALDDFYAVIDSKCMDYIYNEVHEKFFDELYEKYYKNVLDDSDVTDNYSDWLNEHTDFYSNWLSASTDFYSDWLDCSSDFFSDWLNVSAGFTFDNFDVDSLIEKAPIDSSKNNQPEESSAVDKSPEESTSNVSEDSTSLLAAIIRPDVKEAIDSYEEFIDEYCKFMKEYTSSSNPMLMMSEYLDYMQRLSDMSEKFDKIDDSDWTTAETAYYTEVMLRCQNKLLDIV